MSFAALRGVRGVQSMIWPPRSMPRGAPGARWLRPSGCMCLSGCAHKHPARAPPRLIGNIPGPDGRQLAARSGPIARCNFCQDIRIAAQMPAQGCLESPCPLGIALFWRLVCCVLPGISQVPAPDKNGRNGNADQRPRSWPCRRFPCRCFIMNFHAHDPPSKRTGPGAPGSSCARLCRIPLRIGKFAPRVHMGSGWNMAHAIEFLRRGAKRPRA